MDNNKKQSKSLGLGKDIRVNKTLSKAKKENAGKTGSNEIEGKVSTMKSVASKKEDKTSKPHGEIGLKSKKIVGKPAADPIKTESKVKKLPIPAPVKPEPELQSIQQSPSPSQTPLVPEAPPQRRSTARNSILSITDLGTINMAQYKANKRVEEAAFRKQKLVVTLPDQKSGTSGWSTSGFKESLIRDCPAGMELVSEAEYVFMIPASGDFEEVLHADTMHKYELLNINGKRIFFAAEILEDFNDFPSQCRRINLILLGKTGGGVLNISGSDKGCTIANDFNEFGSFRSGKSGVFNIYDETGSELLKILPVLVEGVIEYKVVDFTTNAFVGHIKPSWENKTDEEEGIHLILPNMFGVQFDIRMSPNSKTLLVGFMMYLFFKHNEPLNYGPNRKNFMIGLFYNLLIAGIISILLLIVIMTVIFNKPDKMTTNLANSISTNVTAMPNNASTIRATTTNGTEIHKK